MKNIRKQIFMAVLCAGILICFFVYKKFLMLCILNNYTCVVDRLISPEYQSVIEQKLPDYIQKKYNSGEIITCLFHDFPCIKKAKIIHKPHFSAISVSLYKPLCTINDGLVLVSGNKLLQKNMYCNDVLNALPHLIVDGDTTKVTDVLSRIVATLPYNFHYYYDLRFTDNHFVRLTDKNETKFSIIFSADNSISETFLQCCNVIKNNLQKRNAFAKNNAWIADVRFAQHIVVYKDIGG